MYFPSLEIINIFFFVSCLFDQLYEDPRKQLLSLTEKLVYFFFLIVLEK